MHSSPSHEPVPRPSGRLRRRERPVNLWTQHVGRAKVQPLPRVDGTQSRETSLEPESSGEETAGEWARNRNCGGSNGIGVAFGGEEGMWVEVDMDADWVDEEAGDEEEDLLDLEFHPTFVHNVDKRRRRWETK